jgi:hypothetical protein
VCIAVKIFYATETPKLPKCEGVWVGYWDVFNLVRCHRAYLERRGIGATIGEQIG